MNDAEYDRLHDALDALFPGKVRGCRDGKREVYEVPAFRKEGRIARKEAMKIVRDHLQDRLHGICRDCESGDPSLYDEPRIVAEGARRNLPDRSALPPLPRQAAST